MSEHTERRAKALELAVIYLKEQNRTYDAAEIIEMARMFSNYLFSGNMGRPAL